ncbi:MAG: YbaY family lipoprotein [Woeseiaceae bacterium]
MRAISLALAIGLITSCAGLMPPPQDAVIVGTASYRERIALPPDALFEAVLEDVAHANSKATEIARIALIEPAAPPIHFAIAFVPEKIDSRRSYSIRARILVDGALWFASDAAHPGLTSGAGRTVDILLKRVKEDKPAPNKDKPAPTGRSRLFGGEMVYMADAARFRECKTDRGYPIATEGDFVKLQKAYLKDVKKPGARLYATFEGSMADRPRMEGSGVEQSVVVSRFINA